jgi:predicted DCC family thiol-disulfide oxidoreductase YuxK
MTPVPVVTFVVRPPVLDPAVVTAAREAVVRPVVLYDGTCRMCTRLARLLRRLDRHDTIEVVAGQDVPIETRFPWITRAALAEALHLVQPGGATIAGAEAVTEIVRLLPGGALPAAVLRLPGVRDFADAGYRWVARNRHALGCGTHCRYVPGSEAGVA